MLFEVLRVFRVFRDLWLLLMGIVAALRVLVRWGFAAQVSTDVFGITVSYHKLRMKKVRCNLFRVNIVYHTHSGQRENLFTQTARGG